MKKKKKNKDRKIIKKLQKKTSSNKIFTTFPAYSTIL